MQRRRRRLPQTLYANGHSFYLYGCDTGPPHCRATDWFNEINADDASSLKFSILRRLRELPARGRARPTEARADGTLAAVEFARRRRPRVGPLAADHPATVTDRGVEGFEAITLEHRVHRARAATPSA